LRSAPEEKGKDQKDAAHVTLLEIRLLHKSLIGISRKTLARCNNSLLHQFLTDLQHLVTQLDLRAERRNHSIKGLICMEIINFFNMIQEFFFVNLNFILLHLKQHGTVLFIV
jgi:hypothetical protein